MGRLADVIAALRGKESLVGPLLSFGVEGRPVWTPREYDKLAHEA